jgi:ribonuclease P protein component
MAGVSSPTPSLRYLRSARLVRRSDFQRTYKSGVRVRGEILIVVAAGNELERSRLGLSVGRAIWKSAVKRNRVRRIFREAFRLEQPALPTGLDLILIPARSALEPELAATRAELVRLARKAAGRWDERRKREATESDR